MSGPLGSGEKRYVSQGDWMDYTIYFENQTNATAAAQEIFVDLPIDENLDWTTLELGEIAFGDHIDTSFVGKKPGRKAHLKSAYAMPGTNTFVKTTVTMKDGVLSWYLRDWDPTTVDNFPASATGGFLLPNDPETHCGEGHLSFRVRVKSNAPNGAIIRASAQITFDHNPMIETDPSWWNTVSEDKPMANFAASGVETAEGDVIVVSVSGGNADSASSVDVYLTYNTASATDVDLGKMKFPLTLSWAKGEVGEKVITIPVKADKSVEGDEFLTLQLANAVGVDMGEVDICTVTIKDANTYVTLQDGIMSQSVKAASPGTDKWFVARGSTIDQDGFPLLYHAQSPTIAQGKTSTLTVGPVKGNGCLNFTIRFIGDQNEEVPSSLSVYDAMGKRIGTIDHTQVTNEWHGYYIEISGGSLTASHTYSFVFTQGSDPDTHIELTEVYWDYLGNLTPATFYALYASPNDPAGGYVSGSGFYSYGQTFKLTAKPYPGWKFDGWYEPVEDEETGEMGYFLWSNAATVSYKMNRDANVLAFFSKIPYICALADPADGGKVTGSGLCDKGKKVTLKATANKNFTFLGWSQGTGNGEGGTGNGFVATTATLVIDRSAKPAASSKTTTTITEIDGDVTYFAVFKSDPKVTVAVEATDEQGAVPTGKGVGKYAAGTITGEGKYAPGKKVTLKATANKGYVFSGWEKTGNGERGTGNGEVWSSQAASIMFVMPSNDVAYVATFITADEDKASIDAVVDGWTLEPWVSKTETHAFATNIWAGVYLEWPVAARALSETTVKVAGLPAGLKFADKPVTSKIGTGKAAVTVTNVPAYTIYGAPTAASKIEAKTGTAKPSEVKVTVTTAGKSSQVYQINATVDALPAWAQGTFAGGGLAGRATLPGQVSLTVSAAGKVSGKALGDGLTYTLAAPYYSAFAIMDNGAGMVSNFLADVTATWSYKVGTKTVKTNDVVQVVVHDNGIGGYAAVANWFAAYTVNWKVEPWKTIGQSIDKTTMTYAILSDGTFSESEEDLASALGADVTGRVTLKLAASGAVTVSGEFVTGYNGKKYTTVKATGSATLVPVDGAHGVIFIYLTPKGLSPHARCLDVPWPKE